MGRLTGVDHDLGVWVLAPGALTVFLAVMLVGCNANAPGARYQRASTSASHDLSEDDGVTDSARAAAGIASAMGQAPDCLDVCSPYEAGFEWARENDVSDAAKCHGEEAFVDGCRAYAKQRQAVDAEDDYAEIINLENEKKHGALYP